MTQEKKDQAAPEHIWAVHYETHGAIMNGEWADTVRHLGGIEYIRADLAAPSAPADVEGLVERLRQGTTRIVRHYSSCTIEYVYDADETMAEAATALTAQQAEIERLVEALMLISMVDGNDTSTKIAREAIAKLKEDV